jgi:NitT/TauT family transport system substrate-binding protein
MMSARWFRRLGIGAIVIGLVVAVTGPVVAADQVSLKMSYQQRAQNVANPWFPLAALGHEPFVGIFKKNGIDAKWLEHLSGPDQLKDMAAGELDVADQGMLPWILAATRGADIKVIAGTAIGGEAIITSEDIKSPKDLSGKKMGDHGAGTMGHWVLLVAEKVYGIKMDIRHMRGEEVPIAFERGEIDGAGAFAITAAAINSTGTRKARILALQQDIAPNSPCEVITVNGKLYRENKAAIEKLVRSQVECVQYMAKNPKEVAKMMSAYALSPANAPHADFAMRTWHYSPYMPKSSMIAFVQQLLDFGFIKKEQIPNAEAFVDKYVDFSVVEKVAKEMGVDLIPTMKW